MWEFVAWAAILVAVAAAVAGVAYVARGGSPAGLTGGFFKPRPEPRIEVIEQASMDGKRRLVLIRRDEVEHLLLTGGPVDVVIETGIAPPLTAAEFPQPTQTIGPARAFGQRTADGAAFPPPLGRTQSVTRLQEPELSSPEPAVALAERA
jgi:flagellar protein FliO/FliZ